MKCKWYKHPVISSSKPLTQLLVLSVSNAKNQGLNIWHVWHVSSRARVETRFWLGTSWDWQGIDEPWLLYGMDKNYELWIGSMNFGGKDQKFLKSGQLGDGDGNLFVCLFVCLFVLQWWEKWFIDRMPFGWSSDPPATRGIRTGALA